MPTKHIATLLGATCCVRLATLLRCVGCCWLRFDHFQIWANNTQHVATHRNRVAKRTQHVAPNNIAICCVGMLRSFGRGLTVWSCCKSCLSRMANYFQIFPPLVFSYQLFFFTNRGNFQVRPWVWRKFAAENRVNFQRGDWTGVKWSSQSRKTNFLTLQDLAFGFVQKRSGNEIIS